MSINENIFSEQHLSLKTSKKLHVVIGFCALSLSTFILPLMLYSAKNYTGIFAPSVEVFFRDEASSVMVIMAMISIVWISAAVSAEDFYVSNVLLPGALAVVGFLAAAICFMVENLDSLWLFVSAGVAITCYTLALIIGVALVQRMFADLFCAKC